MAKLALALETLGELDAGRARAVINSAINAAIADLDDRGDDCKERIVTVTVTMVKDEKSGKNRVWVQARAKVPAYRTHTTEARTAHKTGGDLGLFFQSESPENVDQETFDFPDGKTPPGDK